MLLLPAAAAEVAAGTAAAEPGDSDAGNAVLPADSNVFVIDATKQPAVAATDAAAGAAAAAAAANSSKTFEFEQQQQQQQQQQQPVMPLHQGLCCQAVPADPVGPQG
jgi:hypothetical protein